MGVYLEHSLGAFDTKFVCKVKHLRKVESI
jgi:hypothetical protein